MKNGTDLIDEINSYPSDSGTAAFWWLGQLGYVIKLGGKTLYLDAFLSDHPDRQAQPPIQPEEVTNADFIFGSHDHLDHIDRECWHLLSISSPQTKFVVPKLLLPALAEELDISEGRFIGLDDNISVQLTSDIIVTGVASAHEFLDQDAETGACPYLGYVLQWNGQTIYHSGDTCVYEGLYQKLRQFGSMAVMFLPINGRDAKRYSSNIIGNMTYQEAVDLAGTLKPKLVVPGHYEMFASNQEDPKRFADYLAVKYPGIRCFIGEYGEQVTASFTD